MGCMMNLHELISVIRKLLIQRLHLRNMGAEKYPMAGWSLVASMKNDRTISHITEI